MEKTGVAKIAVVGAESTGKTWLCEQLARHYKTVWVPEYAREYFNDSDIYNYTLHDLVVIAENQLQMEADLEKKANGFLFCDTTLITLKIWAELEFRTTPAYIAEKLELIRYDHYFITSNEIPWMEDPLRLNKHSRELLFRLNEEAVKKTRTPYSIISGRDDERLRNAIKIIDNQVSAP